MLAQDGGSPQRSATSTVLITVTRNLNPPQLLQQNYTVSIFETQNLGESIVQIQATDQDVGVSSLFIQIPFVSNSMSFMEMKVTKFLILISGSLQYLDLQFGGYL